jgi:hypothetical protein
MTPSNITKTTIMGLAMWFLAGGSLGCRQEDDKPEHRILTGEVTGIDQETGEVKMMAEDFPAEGMEQEIEGYLASDAEILINGKTALLEEVKIGDSVRVVGRREKEGGVPRTIALKVEVTRPEEIAIGGESETQPEDGDEADTQP